MQIAIALAPEFGTVVSPGSFTHLGALRTIVAHDLAEFYDGGIIISEKPDSRTSAETSEAMAVLLFGTSVPHAVVLDFLSSQIHQLGFFESSGVIDVIVVVGDEVVSDVASMAVGVSKRTAATEAKLRACRRMATRLILEG